MTEYSDEILKLLSSVRGKRARTVIEHILKYGHITTDDLLTTYGYTHPPRAIRDVREQGISNKTRLVCTSDGRQMASYRFGDFNAERHNVLQGRTVLSRRIKSELAARYGTRCNLYMEKTPISELQVDHSVPFEIAGEQDQISIDDYQLLCRSANRDKSWSCEHCSNWDVRNKTVCEMCIGPRIV